MLHCPQFDRRHAAREGTLRLLATEARMGRHALAILLALGLGFAVVALLLRMPFLVVVVGASVVAALARLA